MDSYIPCLLLFSLFIFSSARSPFYSTQINQDNDIPHSFPTPQNDPVEEPTDDILIPNRKPDPEPEPETQIQLLEPESVDVASETSKPTESIDVPTETSKVSNPLPVTILTLRTMDPRIPRRPSPLSFRPNHHRCQHHHNDKNHYFKPVKRHLIPRRPRNGVTRNNVNVDHRKGVIDPVARGEVRPDWMRLGRVEPMLSRERSMALMQKKELLRKLYHRYHHRRQEPAKNKDTGFVKRIRKFLKPF